MPIFCRTRLCITAYGVLHCNKSTGREVGGTVRCESRSDFVLKCRTPYAVIYSLVLLKMGIMLPQTC